MDSEATYDITGSYFENLRIAGHPIEVKLATHVFHEHDTYSKLAKAHHARKTDEWLVGGKLKHLKDDELTKLENEYHALIGMSGLVKEWKKHQTAGGPGKLLVLAGQPSRLEQAGRFVRNPGIWLHHLYSKIRGHSPGGNDSASSFANAADVPGADVLVRTRHGRWWNHNRWRRYYASGLTFDHCATVV